MLQNYKIFSGNVEIIITSDKPKKLHTKEELFVIKSLSEIRKISRLARKGGRLKRIYILHSEPKEALDYLSDCFRHIDAAGGIVKNTKGQILFIYKNKRWDLPKGQVRRKEKKTEAAIREISEECGVKKLDLLRKIGKTYHIGSKKGKRFFKTTHWYEINCEDEYNTSPDLSEGITEVRWINVPISTFYFENTYLNLQNLLTNYLDYKAE